MAAISFPLDILANFPGWSVEFDPRYRQEKTRTAGGLTIRKDLGSPLWFASYVSKTVSANVVDYWRARLASLDGGIQSFYGYHLARCYPIRYPNGSWPTGTAFNGTTAGVTFTYTDRKRIDIGSLPPGFVLSIGDMIQIGDADLHIVQNVVTADSTGKATEVELRPHLWPAAAAGLPVSVRKPHCLMSIDPDTISKSVNPATGRGTISFSAWEAR